MTRSFHIHCDRCDVRLDVYLSEALALTRTRVKDLIEEGHVRIAGKVPKASFKVKESLEIEGEIEEEAPLRIVAEEIPLEILYNDDYLLVVNKPKAMVVHPSFGHRQGTLVNAILSHVDTEGAPDRERPGIVHRLDKDTTGVIIVAKDTRTQDALSRQFHDRKVEKAYRAVVDGTIKEDQGTVEGYIGRHPKDRKRMALSPKEGRYSFSRYKLLKRLKGFTYLEVYPTTGRTHQIRVHLAHIGHPITGDRLYGRAKSHEADRPLLHAYRITFDHPATGARLTIEAPVPPDMEAFVARFTEG